MNLTEPSDQTFRLLLEAAPSAIVVYDREERISLVNLQAQQLFRCRRDELVGRPVGRLFPEGVREDGSLAFVSQVFEDPSPRTIGVGRHLRALRCDGSEFPVEISLNPVQTEQGLLVLGTFVDVTARERAEHRFRLAIESAPSGMVMVDARGRIVLVNSQTEKLFGYRRDELIGQGVELLVPERFRVGHPHDRADFFRRPESRPMGAGRDLYGRHKDGTEFPVEIGLNPIETEEGTFALSAIVDISERKRLEGELHQKLEELAAADRRKDEFLAILAHELRNPLAPMRNAVQLMKMPGLDTATFVQVREMVERQLQQMVRLVDDLLDVSRIVTGRIELRKAPVDIATAVTRGIETAQPILDARGHELVASMPDEPLLIEADLIRLSQVVANLLTNAAKYSPQAERIWLTVERSGEWAVLRVRDRGIGIPPELLPQVFDIFVRGDTPLGRAQGGLGLGLTLVKRVVALHGGSVSATSSGEGQGSEFEVRLPLARRDQPGAGRELDTPRVTDALRRRVLVVDDNVDAADSIALILRHSGYAVRCVYDGQSALQAANAYRPDVVVLDIGLPDISGYEVAKQLRSQPQFEHLPLVAVTGYGQDSDRVRSREAGIDQHLTKPVDPNVLQAFIAHARH